jgi:general secretion pathway protein B
LSLILEALRKSEADRHQESLPESLARQQALLYTTNKRSFYWPWLICLLLVINLAIVGYFIYQSNTYPTARLYPATNIAEKLQRHSVGAHQLSTQQDPSEQVVPLSDDNLRSADDSMRSPGDTQREVIPNASDPVSDSSEHSSRRPAVISLSAARAVLANIVQLPDRSAADSAVVNLPELSSSEVNSEPELIVPSGRSQNQALLSHANQKSAAESETVAGKYEKVKALEASVPHISELDRTFSNSLPRLVFNSHIYSKESTGRRIMINNNYLREGEEFAGITVIEITEDGVVLEKQNRQFLVPVVRDWSPVD